MELVNKNEIQQYAKRNTSPKMDIERKYVYAFLDALLNSKSVQDLYSILSDEMQNGDAFIIFNSFWYTARNVNKEPYRSIIAYSMLKKDIRLFELISASMFTGSVVEYHGNDLYTDVTKTTDESPLKYTDEGLYTDMSEGLIQIGFKNYFCDDPAEDGTGSEYQTLKELNTAILDFDYIITLTKPARVEVLLFYVPYCYLSGDATTILHAGIDTEDDAFECPFGDKPSMDILDTMSAEELLNCYQEVLMYDYKTQTQKNIEATRTVKKTSDAITISFDLRTQQANAADNIWFTIKILSNTGSKIYVKEKQYDENETHYEKYQPIMLKINDNDPDGPCLALQIEHGVPTIGAMFFRREKATS